MTTLSFTDEFRLEASVAWLPAAVVVVETPLVLVERRLVLSEVRPSELVERRLVFWEVRPAAEEPPVLPEELRRFIRASRSEF